MRQVPDRDPALVVTTGLSKNLALVGWRLGVARLPEGRFGRERAAGAGGLEEVLADLTG